jgi:P4 family phage/plasmid primase-like protien
MVGDIINSLVEVYQSGEFGTVPDTFNDNKAVALKEGQIGQVLGSCMVERFRRFHDSLMVFNGKRYELMKPDDVRKLVMGWMTKVGCGPAYLSRSVTSVARMVMDNPFLRNFEPRRNIIYMRNCVLVLSRDGEVVRDVARPELESNIYINLDYIEMAECPRWEKFLDTVICDCDAISVLQEFLGCMFVDKDELSIEKALFLFGSGSNGKSVVFETLKAMLGNNIVNTGLDKINGHNGEYYLDTLIGKLLAYNSDAEAKDISSGTYKQLISKEPVTVRPIRQAPFESDDWPMFMANINKGIITTDSSDGFWRRNIVIGFNQTFSDNPDVNLGQLKADRSFKKSMSKELSGIFNWILAGRRRIMSQKGVFTKSKSIDEITADMRDFSTGVYSYLRDRCYVSTLPDGVQGELKRVLAKDMYNDYCNWCSENGYRENKNINRFRDDMMNAKITWKRCMKVNGAVSTGYVFYQIPSDKVPWSVMDDSDDEYEDIPDFEDDNENEKDLFWNK